MTEPLSLSIYEKDAEIDDETPRNRSSVVNFSAAAVWIRVEIQWFGWDEVSKSGNPNEKKGFWGPG